MRLLRFFALAVPVVAVAVGASGCADTTGTGTTDSGLVFLQHAGSTPGVGDSALLTGVVEDSDGCLSVRDSASSRRYMPVFPVSTSIARSLKPGDQVTLSGGAQTEPPAGVDLPDECSADGPFWMVVAKV